MRFGRLFPAAALLPAILVAADDLPRGQIIESVQCVDDASQSYALYLPSAYTQAKRWGVILGLDAGGRGRNPVVQFQQAAEKYGYIVAGSNNSRNGPMDVSVSAANAVRADLAKRFSVDPKRLYLTGQSGGARAAMYLATTPKEFPVVPAGVIVSSAFSPGPRITSLPFPVFGTAGTEDFNHLEMKKFDRELESTHRLEIFEGGHMWLPVSLATEAIEWMELLAMKNGPIPRDDGFVAYLFARRSKQAEDMPRGVEALRAYQNMAADFEGFRDVKVVAARAAQLARDPAIVRALDADSKIDRTENTLVETLVSLADSLDNPARRVASLAQLRAKTMELQSQSAAPEDSPDRQLARCVLRQFSLSARGSADADLNALLEQIRPASAKF